LPQTQKALVLSRKYGESAINNPRADMVKFIASLINNARCADVCLLNFEVSPEHGTNNLGCSEIERRQVRTALETEFWLMSGGSIVVGN
jgi:hypothetical protein